MSFQTQELSTEDGSPVELYTFQLGGDFFRFTNQSESFSLSGFTWQPLQITSSEPKISKERSGTQLKITLPADTFIATKYQSIVPDERVRLTIERVHRTDVALERVVYWKGRIISTQFNGPVAAMVGEPVQSLFGRELPRRTYQSLCNHVLFDVNCKVLKGSFSDSVEVTSISTDGTTLVLDSLSTARPSDTTFFTGGFVERSNGEKRMILEYTFATDTVRLLLPFSDLVVGEQVTAFAGCSHSVTVCRDKFNNVINFGGYPWVPRENPFQTGLA